jgi:hypothetical protein
MYIPDAAPRLQLGLACLVVDDGTMPCLQAPVLRARQGCRLWSNSLRAAGFRPAALHAGVASRSAARLLTSSSSPGRRRPPVQQLTGETALAVQQLQPTTAGRPGRRKITARRRLAPSPGDRIGDLPCVTFFFFFFVLPCGRGFYSTLATHQETRQRVIFP